MKLFKLSKDFPHTIYKDPNLYYVWIYNGTGVGFDYMLCTSVYAIAYLVSYIEAQKRRKRTGSYFYAIFKGRNMDHYGYWGKNSNGKFEFLKL